MSMDPYTSSSGGPLGLGGGGLQSSLSTPSNRSGGGPLGGPLPYGMPAYPSGGSPAGLLPPSGLSSTDTPMHAHISMKGPQGGAADISGIGPGNAGAPAASGGPFYASPSKYTPSKLLAV